MSLLNSLKPEYRNAIVATRLYVEPPAKTPAHIKARMVASMTAYCEKRSLTPFEERCYQQDATHFHAQRPQVIAKRTAARVTQTATIDRRHGVIALRYKALSYEQIKRAVKFNYDEDTLNILNLVELRKQIRQGVAFEAEPMRYQSGGAEDPEQKFRDDEGQIWPEAASTKEEHEESAEYHANCAGKAKSLHEAEGHYHAADRHKYAAEHPNDTLASDRARDSSRIVRG